MTPPVRPESRIERNVAALRAQGASEQDIESYLTEHEHLAPEPQSHGASRDFGDEPTPENFATYGAGSFPFVTKTKALIDASVDKITGNAPAGFGAAYNRRYEADAAGREQYRSENPKKAFTAAVLGNAIPALVTLGTGEAPTAIEATAAGARGLGSKILRGIGVGAGTGVAQGVSEGHGSVSDYVDKVERNALLGGAVGGAAPIVTGAAGSVLRRTNAPDMISKGAEKLGLSKIANAVGTKGKAADVLAQRVESDQASGFVPKAPTKGVPSLPLDQAGPDVQGLAEGIASRPGLGRSTLVGRITARQQEMRPSVTKALEEGTGVPAGSGLAPLESEIATLKAKGDEAFGAARKATAGQAVESPTLNEIKKTDIGKDAYAWAMNRRGELPGKMPGAGVPSGIKPEDWQNMQRLAKERNAAATASREIPIQGTATAGRKQDFTKLGTDDLLGLLRDEQGVLERNANKPRDWTRFDDDISTQLSGGTLGGAIGKQQAGFANNRLTAIESELKRRGVDEDLIQELRFSSPDVPLTRTVPGGPAPFQNTEATGEKLPDPETLHLMKRFLYQVSSGKMPGANTKQAAEAAGALNQWGKIRKELPPEWRQADDIYAQYAKRVDASNAGRGVFQTRINPTTQNPRKAVAQSLKTLRERVAQSPPEERQATQQGAGSAAHALWESTPNGVKSPGRVFAKSPERVQQTSMAMKSPEAADAFQKQLSAWDAIQEQANRLLGNSRTATRGAENAAATPELPSAIQAVRHPLRTIESVVKGNVAERQRVAREKLDAAIADFLTGPDISSIPNALMVARLRRSLAAKTPNLAPIALAGGATAR